MGNNAVYIRADGNVQIGTGHIMRCLSIAHAVRAKGVGIVFVTADENMKPLLDEQGFPVICLNSTWSDLDGEIEQMEELIKRDSIKTLLVDSYFATAKYLSHLHQLTYVACMDDLHDFVRPCSTVINYNLYSIGLSYTADYPNDTTLLLGAKYTPLREEFQHISQRVIREQCRNVLVTTGGSDSLNIAGHIVRLAKQCSKTADLTYHVVAGRFNQHLDMLEELSEKYPGVVIHRNVQKMSELMLSCDLAISASGSTLYELSACGTPTICFAWADNQLPGVAAFGNGYMQSVGDIRTDFDGTLDQILDEVARLASCYEERQRQAKALQTLVDGNGAERIARALLKSC